MEIVGRVSLEAPQSVVNARGRAVNNIDAKLGLIGQAIDVSGAGSIQSITHAALRLTLSPALLGGVGAVVNRAELAPLVMTTGAPETRAEGMIIDPYAAARLEDAALSVAFLGQSIIDD